MLVSGSLDQSAPPPGQAFSFRIQIRADLAPDSLRGQHHAGDESKNEAPVEQMSHRGTGVGHPHQPPIATAIAAPPNRTPHPPAPHPPVTGTPAPVRRRCSYVTFAVTDSTLGTLFSAAIISTALLSADGVTRYSISIAAPRRVVSAESSS